MKIKKYGLYLSFILILTVAFMKIRVAFFLPEVELPIIVYKQIVDIPNSPDEVSYNRFHIQLSDLYVNGFQTVTPARLRAYKAWGRPLPQQPFMISIENIDKEQLNYTTSVLTNYNFTATISIPEEKLNDLLKGTDSKLATKEELLKYKENNIYSYGIRLTEIPEKGDALKSVAKEMKKRLEIAPEMLTFPKTPSKKEAELLCSAAGATIGIHEEKNSINKLNKNANFSFFKHQKIIGNRLTFSITAIRHPGALAAAEIYISQPVGERFNARVSVLDKNGDLLLDKYYDELPLERTLFGKLKKEVQYPITVYITDATGMIFYISETFNRYTIERGEPVPLEIEINEELEKELDKIDIPLDI